jgi:prepilin-type N-terminal cleavage/methylation domain-containing protein
MTIQKARKRAKSGFTLIELSIVLVIIGLIVGGVLVGQDLIKAAEVRATIGQYEKYNATVNTFRTKYNGIPGDLAAASASAFGLCPTAGCMAGTTGLGDNSGLVTDTGGSATLALGEPLAFWQQMTASNLIDGNYGAALTAGGAVATNTTGASVGNFVPPARIGRGNFWNAGAVDGINYYMLSGFGTTPISTTGTLTFAGAITPIEAFNIDTKIDDGAPNTGTVQARGTIFTGAIYAALTTANHAAYLATPTSSTCITGTTATDTSNTYARGTISGNNPNCILRMRFN